MSRKDGGMGELQGFLDQGTTFSGEVTFQDTLRIDGKFEGAVRSGRKLVIGEAAEVDAEIEVAILSVSGKLRGSVRASERIELLPTARVECRLDCKALVVHEGASFDGQCTMTGQGPKPQLALDDKLKPAVSSK